MAPDTILTEYVDVNLSIYIVSKYCMKLPYLVVPSVVRLVQPSVVWLGNWRTPY